jgi:hypothetical protein
MTNDIAKSFTNPVLTPLPTDRNPSAMDIRNLKQELVANALTIASTRGGGSLGHTALCLTPDAYLLLPGAAGIAWVDPVHPGQSPVLPAVPTAAQITEANRVHKLQEEEYARFKDTEAALRKCLLDAVPSHCIDTLKDELFGYAAVTPRAILQLLITSYALVTTDDLISNTKQMATPWDPSTPLTTLWQQLRTAQLFAAGHDPISDATLKAAALVNLEQSGVFLDALKDFRKRAQATQTYANLQLDFTHADKERLRNTTSRDAGFAGNMKQAITEDKENRSPKGLFYCWTHGLGSNPKHDSKSCSNKQHGHRDESTIYNMCGGNNRIHRRYNEKAVYVAPQRTNKGRNNERAANPE